MMWIETLIQLKRSLGTSQIYLFIYLDNAIFSFCQWASIKFEFWPFVIKALGISAIHNYLFWNSYLFIILKISLLLEKLSCWAEATVCYSRCTVATVDNKQHLMYLMVECQLEVRMTMMSPVRAEYIERGRFVSTVVELQNRIRDGVPGNHLLVLNGGTLEGLSHVDILQRD